MYETGFQLVLADSPAALLVGGDPLLLSAILCHTPPRKRPNKHSTCFINRWRWLLRGDRPCNSTSSSSQCSKQSAQTLCGSRMQTCRQQTAVMQAARPARVAGRAVPDRGAVPTLTCRLSCSMWSQSCRQHCLPTVKQQQDQQADQQDSQESTRCVFRASCMSLVCQVQDHLPCCEAARALRVEAACYMCSSGSSRKCSAVLSQLAQRYTVVHSRGLCSSNCIDTS